MLTRRDVTKLAVLGTCTADASRLFAQALSAKSQHAVTSYVADFILNTRYEDIPSGVLELARKSILDGLGLALCGSVAKSGEIVRTYLGSIGVASKSAAAHAATVIGSSLKAPVRFAAFANAVGIHADDYDDTQLAVVPRPCVRPADASHRARSSRGAGGGGDRQDLRARICCWRINVGVEVECKIAEAIAPRHYEDGFHSTGTCGAFGSASAARQAAAASIAEHCPAHWASPPAKPPDCARTSAP